MKQSPHISIKILITLIFSNVFFFDDKLFRFCTKLKQKCVSASVLDFFCKGSGQVLSNSLTSSVAEVFRFPFCLVLGLQLEVRDYGRSIEETLYWIVKQLDGMKETFAVKG